MIQESTTREYMRNNAEAILIPTGKTELIDDLTTLMLQAAGRLPRLDRGKIMRDVDALFSKE